VIDHYPRQEKGEGPTKQLSEKKGEKEAKKEKDVCAEDFPEQKKKKKEKKKKADFRSRGFSCVHERRGKVGVFAGGILMGGKERRRVMISL